MQLMWAATNNPKVLKRNRFDRRQKIELPGGGIRYSGGRISGSLTVEHAAFAGRLPDCFADVAAARAFFGYFAARPKLRLLSEIALTRLFLNAWCKLKTIQGLRIHLRLLLASVLRNCFW